MLTMFSLLFLGSLVVLSTAKTIKANSTVVRNQIFEDQAFEAAEAGGEFGLVHLKDNRSTILVDTDSDGYIDSYAPAATTNVNNGNGTTYTITYSNPTANNFDITQISVVGTTDGGSVTKNITQLAIRIPYLKISPPAGFITKDGVTLGGNVHIENTVTGTTIWSGGGVSLSGSADTNGGGGVTSDRRNINTDIAQNDAQLSGLTNNEFFESFIGSDKATAESSADIVLTYNGNQNLSAILDPDENNGKIIWVNQDSGTARFSGNATIGSPEEPVILIIDGDFKANGTTDIYGLVYVTQDWHNSGGGNLTIHGAVIVEGAFSGTGTPNIPVILQNACFLGR
jgi:Tfp pilus assembly protein PilX